MLKRYLHLFTAWKQPLHYLQLTILFHLLEYCIYKISRARTDQSLILEKVLKFALFQTLKKSGKSG